MLDDAAKLGKSAPDTAASLKVACAFTTSDGMKGITKAVDGMNSIASVLQKGLTEVLAVGFAGEGEAFVKLLSAVVQQTLLSELPFETATVAELEPFCTAFVAFARDKAQKAVRKFSSSTAFAKQISGMVSMSKDQRAVYTKQGSCGS